MTLQYSLCLSVRKNNKMLTAKWHASSSWESSLPEFTSRPPHPTWSHSNLEGWIPSSSRLLSLFFQINGHTSQVPTTLPLAKLRSTSTVSSVTWPSAEVFCPGTGCHELESVTTRPDVPLWDLSMSSESTTTPWPRLKSKLLQKCVSQVYIFLSNSLCLNPSNRVLRKLVNFKSRSVSGCKITNYSILMTLLVVAHNS